jgi:hypothetical protein
VTVVSFAFVENPLALEASVPAGQGKHAKPARETWFSGQTTQLSRPVNVGSVWSAAAA